MAILSIVMRYIHIVSAIVLVGGMTFMLLCLSPAARLLDEPLRKQLIDAVYRRFTRVLWVCIGGLLLSGAYTWITLSHTYKAMGPYANALIGTKVLIALVIFAIVFARSFGFIRADNPRRVLMINIHLAAIVILLASILRYYRLEYLQHGIETAQSLLSR